MVKSTEDISQNFVAFSEYMNFKLHLMNCLKLMFVRTLNIVEMESFPEFIKYVNESKKRY